MGQMTPETSRMVGTLSGDPVPFLIPIVLTVILLIRHHISFKSKTLWAFVVVMFCWSYAVCDKVQDFRPENLSYYFFLFYAIFIAYIQVRVYGRDLFPIFEHIMVVFSVISLMLWGMSLLLPFTNSFFHLFPETNMGNNVFYLYHWLDPLKELEEDVSLRNSGCSWEAGRFAIMLISAIFINLSREGVKFRKNKKIIILLAALASTMSTTGYSIAILLYAIYWFEQFTVKRSIYFVVLILPICWYLFSLDFMTEKIEDKLDFEELTRQRMGAFEYVEENQEEGRAYVLDRFESAYLDWMNFQEDPLLGYGRNRDYSWFRQEISDLFDLSGGLVKILSQYGIFIGILLYSILFFSSIEISRLFQHQRKFAFVLAQLLCSISYPVFSIPVFTAFWLYGLFDYKDNNRGKRILIEKIDNGRACLQ